MTEITENVSIFIFC